MSNTRKGLFGLLAGSILLSGCVAMQGNLKGPDQPLPNEYVIEASFDKVWGAIMERATEKSWPIKTIDKASGVVATDFVLLSQGISSYRLREVAYEPKTLLGTWEGARQTLNIFVSKLDENKTRVKIRCHFEGFESNVDNQWIEWESNGTTEKALAESIGRTLNAQVKPNESAVNWESLSK